MCGFSSPKAPPPTAIPEAPRPVEQPSAAPQESDAAISESRTNERRRRLSAKAENTTLVTGARGVTAPASVAYKSAFGQ